MAQLAAYLMVPPCEEFYLQQVVSVSAPKVTVVEFCQFSACLSGWNHIGLVLFLIAKQPVFQMPLVGRRPIAAQGPVSLVNFSFSEHLGQPFQGF